VGGIGDDDRFGMEITLNTDILVKALQQYQRDNGRGSLAELHRITGVHNIGRIARGETKPTLDTWLQLYLSAREDIPPPTTVTGGRLVLIGDDEDQPPAASGVTSKHQIPGEQQLWEKYATHRSIAVVRAFTEALDRIEKATRVK
jgi:hypothetical protein